MASGAALRYDRVPLDDFLACLMRHDQDVRPGYLPPAAHLKEVRLETACRVGSEPFALTLYLLQETEALSQTVEVFLLLQGPASQAAALRVLALKLKGFLERRQMPGLFRIDPRYGLVCGSSLEPVDPSVHWDRPGAYVALYLTEDPAAPSLALLEYVPQASRRLYRELFLKYNGVVPAAPGLIRSAWKKLVGEDHAKGQAASHLSYRQVKHLAAFLRELDVEAPCISLIYKDMGPGAGSTCLLDPGSATACAAGNDRFFASLGELA
jgi:hypothetical protein